MEVVDPALEQEARRLATRNYNQQHIVGMRSSTDARTNYVESRWRTFLPEARVSLANPLQDEKYTCNTCYKLTPTLWNGQCDTCAQLAAEAWKVRIAKRMPTEQFDMRKLVNLLLLQHWMHECEIIKIDKGGYAQKEGETFWIIKYVYKSGAEAFLRYGGGVVPIYFWDMAGDNLHSPELALLALSKCPPPPHIDRVIPTYGV